MRHAPDHRLGDGHVIGFALIVVGMALLTFALYLILDLYLWATEPGEHELFVLRVRRWLGWR